MGGWADLGRQRSLLLSSLLHALIAPVLRPRARHAATVSLTVAISMHAKNLPVNPSLAVGRQRPIVQHSDAFLMAASTCVVCKLLIRSNHHMGERPIDLATMAPSYPLVSAMGCLFDLHTYPIYLTLSATPHAPPLCPPCRLMPDVRQTLAMTHLWCGHALASGRPMPRPAGADCKSPGRGSLRALGC